MATAKGWAGTSSGRTRIGFWQPRTKSRVTVKTKSGLVSNMLVTNWSVVWIVISGRLAISAAPQLFQKVPGYLGSRISGRQHCRGNTIRRALQKTPDEGAANAETHHHELVDPQMIHQAKLVVGIGFPRPLDLHRAGRLAAGGIAQVRRDAAILSFELLDRVKWRV